MHIRIRLLCKILMAGMIVSIFPLKVWSDAQIDRLYVDVHMHLDGVAQAGAGRQDPDQHAGEREGRRRGRGPRGQRRGDSSLHLEKVSEGKRWSGPGGRDYLPAAAALVRVMDEYGVAKAVVMPPPQRPDKENVYHYRDLLPVVQAHPDRLALGAGGGVLNPLIGQVDPEHVTDDTRRKFEEEAMRIVRDGAKVFGEMTAMHLCMNPKHHYIASPPDHPLFLLLADIVARQNIPIDLHMEAIEKDMTTPEALSQACDQNPDILPATIAPFERLLAHNRQARIVWQHIGWDNTGQMTPQVIRRLLRAHSNLSVAIKAVPVEEDHVRPNRIHDDQWRILPEWLELFRDFPDRFVVGADEFINVGGGAYKKPPFFKETWKAFQSLPPDLMRKIGRDNAVRVYGL